MAEEKDLEGWITLSQSAERLGISRQAVSQAIDSGRLPAKRLGNMWIVAIDDVVNYGSTRGTRVTRRSGSAPWFWKKVKMGDGCWEWQNGKSAGGYGNAFWQGKQQYAHRVAWELFFGDIPEGMMILHQCDNPACVRPDHLVLGTAKDNAADRETKGRGKRRAARARKAEAQE